MEERIYIITRIEEADYGCEERTDGYKPMVRVHLCDKDGNVEIVEMEDALMYSRKLDEGSEAMIGLDGALYSPDMYYNIFDGNEIHLPNTNLQNEWYDNYMNALEELEEDE